MTILKYFVFLIFALLSGCEPADELSLAEPSLKTWKTDNAKIKVLATTGMIGELVRQVGGGQVDVWVLIRGELDPHSYQLVKGDDEKLSFSQIIFFNGLGLEHGPSLQRYLHQSQKAVNLGDYIKKKSPHRLLSVQGQVDPHIWMDISLWMSVVPLLVETLSRYDPSHADDFRANGELLTSQMDQAHQKTKSLLHSIPEERRYLVTSHDAFNYFARAYLATDQELLEESWQKRFAAPEGLAPDSQLSAVDIQNMIQYLCQHQIKVLFTESNLSRDSIRKIVSAGTNMGLNLQIATDPLYGDSIGPVREGENGYIKMIEHNAATIAKYL